MYKHRVFFIILSIYITQLSSQNYHDNFNYPLYVSEMHIYATNMTCVSDDLYWHQWKNMDFLINNCSYYMCTSQGYLIEEFYELFWGDSNLLSCNYENDTFFRFEGMSNVYAEFEPIIVVRFLGAFDACGKRRWDEIFAIDRYGFIVDGSSKKYFPNKKIMSFLESYFPKKMFLKFEEYKAKP